MTLTIADIDRWEAGAVREVFHAATSRAQASFDAANGLAELPAFATWGGVAAEAAKEAIGKTRKDLDADGREALAVANAARSAADEIERIKSELATVRADAELLGMEIDPVSNAVLPGRTVRNPMEAELKQEQLQPRVNTIVAKANVVDMALANALHMADGTTPIPRNSPTVPPLPLDWSSVPRPPSSEAASPKASGPASNMRSLTIQCRQIRSTIRQYQWITLSPMNTRSHLTVTLRYQPMWCRTLDNFPTRARTSCRSQRN